MADKRFRVGAGLMILAVWLAVLSGNQANAPTLTAFTMFGSAVAMGFGAGFVFIEDRPDGEKTK